MLTPFRQRILHIPAYGEMLINSGIRLRRCIIDPDIHTERHIQKFCDFLYSIRIPNPNIIVLADPVEFYSL